MANQVEQARANFLAARVEPEVLAQEYDAATQMVSDLCQGKREWLMSIPALPHYDPDLVISTALRHLNAEVAYLRGRLSEVHCARCGSVLFSGQHCVVHTDAIGTRHLCDTCAQTIIGL